MADNIECETCGGTDFYRESGYFFCKECQTQSQEIREHEFQDEVVNIKDKSTRRIKQPLPDSSKSKLTSWECYNIIISSLTRELIDLGADKSLRSIIKCLWMRYLEKLQVVHLHSDDLPRLQLVNIKKDARILYEKPKKKKRKRKKSTSDESGTTHDSALIKRERNKKKTALAVSQYEVFSQKSTQESTSLHNETLSSLKGSSEKSAKAEGCLRFNAYSIKELRKTASKHHCRKHKLDTAQNLKCHKLTYTGVSHRYEKSAHFISPLKIYSILYLGLLIIRDKIQLGDLLRFIREGRLTFNSYTHLFPESYAQKFLNVKNNQKNVLFTNRAFRITSAKVAQFLDVSQYIQIVDLTQLCQRYCKELNLPDELLATVINIISRTHPNMPYTKKTQIVPDYEGRAVSLILFTLKLLFGLDGKTEFELSRYARLVNDVNIDKPKMFNVIKWLEYVGYRNLVVSKHHFPDSYKEDSEEIDSDLFLQYIKSRTVQLNESIKLTSEMSDYKDVLMRIKELQDDAPVHFDFPVSLTPFLDYAKMLIACVKEGRPKDVLRANFVDDSLDFLLKPNKYLQLVGESVTVKNGGANDNWIMEDVKTYRHSKNMSNHNFSSILVEVLNTGCEERDIDEIHPKPEPKKTVDPFYVQETYQKCRQDVFDKNKVFVNKVSCKVDLNANSAKLVATSQERYKTHFNPYERYWLHLQMNIHRYSHSDFDEYFETFASTFKIIFRECARIVEQTEQELLEEFQQSELYLVYSATFCEKRNKNVQAMKKKKTLVPKDISFYIKQAEASW